MFDKRFIVIAGKGGVGRTTISAALATLLARKGRRVLLAHVRTKQRVGQMLGCQELDENIREVEPNLWAVNMNPRAALREQGIKVLRFKAVYRAVMENRLVKYFLKAIPSLDEYSMLGKAWFHSTEKNGDDQYKYETVIFDGPATGHLITMLRIPKVILDVVPEGPLTKDASKVYELLTDPQRAAIWIVTLAEEMAAREALDLHRAATEDLQMAVDRILVNALYPDDFENPELARALEHLNPQADPLLQSLFMAAKILRDRRLINRRYLDLLGEHLSVPIVELPYLFVKEMDRPALDQISDQLV